ncbi:MAG: EAL domain-containing protein [Bacillota bacterium]
MTLPNLMLVQPLAAPEAANGTPLPEIIHLLRQHLGMDVAFLAEFVRGRREFRYVDTDEHDGTVRNGEGCALEESYCQRIVDGRLPDLIPDVNDFPEAKSLSVTRELNIQSYLAAPIRLADGTVYGTFCCYSHTPDNSLNERDLAMMRICADMAARQIDRERQEKRKRHEMEERIRTALAQDGVSMVYQPIYALAERRVVGFEALSRFAGEHGSPPDVFFNEAHAVGLGIPLEARTIGLGLRGLQELAPEVYVSVNISPDTILSPAFDGIFRDMPLERVTLEITEHAAVDRYQEIADVLRPIRARGLQLAVDDAGAGYASFRHILALAPDRIKLDCSLTKNIDTDPARRALIAAFVRFAEDTAASLIAEGVETEKELEALLQLGVAKAQGHLLGRPMPIGQAAQLLHV